MCPSLQGQAGEVNYFYRFGMLGPGLDGRMPPCPPPWRGLHARPPWGASRLCPRRREWVLPGALEVSRSSCPRRGVGWGWPSSLSGQRGHQ